MRWWLKQSGYPLVTPEPSPLTVKQLISQFWKIKMEMIECIRSGVQDEQDGEKFSCRTIAIRKDGKSYKKRLEKLGSDGTIQKTTMTTPDFQILTLTVEPDDVTIEFGVRSLSFQVWRNIVNYESIFTDQISDEAQNFVSDELRVMVFQIHEMLHELSSPLHIEINNNRVQYRVTATNQTVPDETGPMEGPQENNGEPVQDNNEKDGNDLVENENEPDEWLTEDM